MGHKLKLALCAYLGLPMKGSIGTWRVLSCITLILLAGSVANATLIPVSSPFAGSGVANWGSFSLGETVGSSGTCGASTLTTAIDSPLTISFSSGNCGVVYQQGTSGTDIFNGGFASGQFLLNNNGAGSLTITFGSPVQEFGVEVEELDGQTQNFSAVISTTSEGGGAFTAVSGTGEEWVGIEATSGAFITSVTINTTSSSSDSGKFLVGTGEFSNTIVTTVSSTPEPDSLLLIVGGLPAVICMARKRLRA